MSCNCQHTGAGDTAQFPCPCDGFVFPAPLNIGAGLTDIPRQIAGFPEFRRDMLYLLRSKTPLAGWHASKPDDMGLLLLEMWAYVCDIVSFYDKVIAEELYLSTAIQRSSLRKLVALLGYLPAPAVATTAQLAARASGKQPLTLPAGTAFRSGAFNGNPPQVFELGTATMIDPAANAWTFLPPHPGVVATNQPSSLAVKAVLVPNAGDPVLLVDTVQANNNLGLIVSGTSNTNGVTTINFTGPTNLVAGKSLNELSLLIPRSMANINAVGYGGSPSAIELVTVARQIKVDDLVLVTGTKDTRWFSIEQVIQTVSVGAATTVTINGSSFTTPGPSTPVTVAVLDAAVTDAGRGNAAINGGSPVSWSDAATAQLVLRYNLQSVGALTDLPKTTLADRDPLVFAGAAQPPAEALSGVFLLQDANLNGTVVTGMADFTGVTGLIAGDSGAVVVADDNAQLKLNANQGWNPDLVLPVQAFGNVLEVSRGQTVSGEILGNGDATQSNQTFQLQKKPLTYLLAPTAENNSGVMDTLTVYVGGIRWKEVTSFYGQGMKDQVFIVRQNDAGESLVIFGDGVRGQRLPTGISNIVANYRYGAGLAAPPAGSINQIAKPVKGLQSVTSVTAAAGGDDAEGPDSLRTSAPKTALILGRAVSIDDMEAVALAFPGVVTAQAEWRWEKEAQAALVHVWYIGDATIASKLYSRLTGLSDPTVMIQVDQAVAKPVQLSLSVDVDDRFVADNVRAAVSTALSTGLLATGTLGIGNPLFRSQLFAAVLAVEGTTEVSGIFWNGKPLTAFAKTPGSGNYFDFTLSL